MEELRYIVEDSTIAQLLGVQNFTNKESAILELVKNAFDAKSLKVEIIFDKGSITIRDEGIGMNKHDIIEHWMHVGKSDKGYETKDENGNKRILAGSKGIGRFALARLGGSAKMHSYKLDNSPIVWKTDWSSSSIEEGVEKKVEGTEIIIEYLRDRWSEKAVANLIDYLSRTYNDDVMEIFVTYNQKKYSVGKYFANLRLGENFSASIDLNYNSEKKSLDCTIKSDEFRDEAAKYCPMINIHYYMKSINMLDEFIDQDFDDEIENLDLVLNQLGSFSANLYFGLDKVLSGSAEKFLYKRRELIDKFEYGIILYRNSFSISSYEGKRDWLGLGKRSRKSPAAATHPTGSWRVRENQVAGKVNIDKKENPYLQDLSNRQGLDENSYYKVFVKILQKGLSEFEHYRQGIIREINKKNTIIYQQEKKVTDKIIKNPTSLKTLSKNEEKEFVDELKTLKKESKEFKKNIDLTEKRYKYDIRILNVLATSGLKATSIAHEMKNDRNNIASNYDYIVKALVKYEMWDDLQTQTRTKYTHENVPRLLSSNKYISGKIVRFMDTMLEEVEKRQFYAEEYNMLSLVKKIKENWLNDYAWINIQLDIGDNLLFTVPEDVVKVIFDNLLLNSIQQNDDRSQLDVKIQIVKQNKLLRIQYSDNGKGLPSKFLNTPRLILEPHETSREKGHGLGMWIINNTLEMSGGEVIDIIGTKGFFIDFTLGGDL